METHVVRYTHPHDSSFYVHDVYTDGVFVKTHNVARIPAVRYWGKEPSYCIEGCKVDGYNHVGCCFR